jgi:O-acetyl-ADP-ribose deacetylase (regulator of RNase III)
VTIVPRRIHFAIVLLFPTVGIWDHSTTTMPSLQSLATFGLGRSTHHHNCTSSSIVKLVVAQGSVVNFHQPDRGAIVNAANEGCLGGGGVDGAITQAGGPTLAKDRFELPIVTRRNMDWIIDVRCPTGSAVLTGPGNYGSLKVPFVIHAVGPNYYPYQESFDTPDRLLRSAYQSSLDRCLEYGITHVAFSLLSAGVFRGKRSVKDILTIGIQAIQDWSDQQQVRRRSASAAATSSRPTSPQEISLQTVTLCGFSDEEITLLLEICNANLQSDVP